MIPQEGLPFIFFLDGSVDFDRSVKSHWELIPARAEIDFDSTDFDEATAQMSHWMAASHPRIGRFWFRMGKLEFTLSKPLRGISAGSEQEEKEEDTCVIEQCRQALSVAIESMD